jgi:hypothetical protein
LKAGASGLEVLAAKPPCMVTGGDGRQNGRRPVEKDEFEKLHIAFMNRAVAETMQRLPAETAPYTREKNGSPVSIHFTLSISLRASGELTLLGRI